MLCKQFHRWLLAFPGFYIRFLLCPLCRDSGGKPYCFLRRKWPGLLIWPDSWNSSVFLPLPVKIEKYQMPIKTDISMYIFSFVDVHFLAVRQGSHWTGHLLERCLTILFTITVPLMVERPGKRPKCPENSMVCISQSTDLICCLPPYCRKGYDEVYIFVEPSTTSHS